MDAKEVAKTFREWATEMFGYPSSCGPFPECFALVALRSLASMKSLALLEMAGILCRPVSFPLG